MAKELGPTFGEEVMAAGLQGAPFGWGPTDETISGRENLTAAQNTILDSVVYAHDPSKRLVPVPQQEQVTAYDHENRIRALEGQPPLTLLDFVQKQKGVQPKAQASVKAKKVK